MVSTAKNYVKIFRICLFVGVSIAGLFTSGNAILFDRAQAGLASRLTAPTPATTATLDPLAIPELPENPSKEELGKHVYYYNCMPCHGDQGQGLTEAWRQVWEEDHRQCWDRGCHGGRIEDEGFPIPTVVPAVILEGDALRRYTTEADLVAYLLATHPPQSPGSLAEMDYQAVAAYLWAANGKPESQATETVTLAARVEATRTATLTPAAEATGGSALPCSSVGMVLIAVVGVVVGYQARSNHQRRLIHSQNSDPSG